MQNLKPTIRTTKAALKKPTPFHVEAIKMLDYLNKNITDCEHKGRAINPLVLSSIIDIIYRLLMGELVLKKHTLGDLKNLIDSGLQE
ncbi:hypothetical protein [Methylobacter psychrophilus]|uniref:hypothetical protein n=1 Tax=Methylobacter psychrophilus TaxID=96941 RepID=UPI0021D4DDA7|nr:hypothetical protein [Methylobacter psychrophilus]